MDAEIVVETPVQDTPRVLQLRGLFDITAEKTSHVEWRVHLPIDSLDWHVGLIVGPSGSGKSTIASHLWPREIAQAHRWPKDKAVVDAFPPGLPIKEITELLSSVGFSSPPSWLRPYGVLSTGERFRVDMARTLAEAQELAVVDEFTSVVDRTVAQVGAAAIAKTVRRRNQQLIAVTCHEDVEPWLQPDWTYRPATNEFSGRYLQPRPPIILKVCRVTTAAWELFRHHHYLDATLHKGAVCFGAFWEDRLVAFIAWLPHVGKTKGKPIRRISRIVCLPDYQGVGVGHALMAVTAAMWKALGSRPRITAAHPGLIRSCNQSRRWAMVSTPKRSSADEGPGFRHINQSHATRRLVASFEFVGDAMAAPDARRLRECHARLEQPA